MLPLWIIDLTENKDRNSGWCDKMKLRISHLRGADTRWRYTTTERVDGYIDLMSEKEVDDGEWLKNFRSLIVSEGREFVRMLYQSNPSNDPVLNVCIIGNSLERRSLRLFSSTAAVIKKLKPIIVPDHIHIGLNIIGMLFIPYDVNALSFYKRQHILRCLRELHVQNRVKHSAGYDKVMLFQDSQHRTEKVYGRLEGINLVDYVFQCLVHLYYACDDVHPLIDGTHVNDDFYFSMGVGSLYYDTVLQDNKEAALVGNSLFATFKQKGSEETLADEVQLLENHGLRADELYEAELKDKDDFNEDVLDNLVPDCPVHPVNNFASLSLERRFYNNYLPSYVERFVKSTINAVSSLTRDRLVRVNEKLAVKREKVLLSMKAAVEGILRKSSHQRGSATLVKTVFTNFREELQSFKEKMRKDDVLENHFWEPVFSGVSKRYNGFLKDYHEAYRADDKDEKSSGTNCDTKKAEAMDRLVALLENDSTILSRIGRAFLAGIVCVLVFVPFLELLSPRFINIGRVSDFSWLYGAFIFLIPMAVEIYRFYKFHWKRKKLEDTIKAYYLHDSYARLANRLQNQIELFYEALMGLCDKYIARCDRILETDKPFSEKDAKSPDIPETMFNIPVMGGRIGTKEVFPKRELDYNTLRIEEEKVRIDKISEEQYYTLIRKFSEDMSLLYERVGDALSEEEEERNWNFARTQFVRSMEESISSVFIKRSDSTVGDKLFKYSKTPENRAGFDLFNRFCSTNGELTVNDNDQFGDLKTNRQELARVFEPIMPVKTSCQVYEDCDPAYPLYTSYLFLTRWRTFDFVSANRIIPELKLDDRDFAINNGFVDSDHSLPVSTLFLYSLIQGLSSEWYLLIDPFHLNKLIEAHRIKEAEQKEKADQEEQEMIRKAKAGEPYDDQMNNAENILDIYIGAMDLKES